MNCLNLDPREFDVDNGDLIAQVEYADRLIAQVYDLVETLEAAREIGKAKSRAMNKLSEGDLELLGLKCACDSLDQRDYILGYLIEQLKFAGQGTRPAGTEG